MEALAIINNSTAVNDSTVPFVDNAMCANNNRKVLTCYFAASAAPPHSMTDCLYSSMSSSKTGYRNKVLALRKCKSLLPEMF
jgi:hypothetical protein